MTEVAVGEGATVRHYKVQRESARAFHVGTAEVRQAKDSHYVSFSFATGAKPRWNLAPKSAFLWYARSPGFSTPGSSVECVGSG